MSSDDEKVITAFRNSKYTWRTVRGVAKETGINQDLIQAYVTTHGDRFVKSSSTNTRGESLFAERSTYRKKASPIRRLFAAVVNRGG